MKSEIIILFAVCLLLAAAAVTVAVKEKWQQVHPGTPLAQTSTEP